MIYSDIPNVLKLWSLSEGVFLHTNGEDSEEGIALYLERNPGFSYIAKNNENKIIGAVLSGHDGRRGLIHHLAVDEKYRKNGIANKLMSLSIEKLKREKIKKVLLFVLNNNIEAIKFYDYNNWIQEETVGLYSKIL
ncbi:MAG: hypothetical protein A2015_01515 [Spirochaetes bacterium GWF1_31_7]|nr:MAG: hypothetical protein A2Y29_09450 [Spirochaetes bacterium GWE2_31_10]OHD51140.1 MAG: hypothetical protein A2015_01515 [Spirochaetes bacterium GWF1_31_7]OHD80033.1 MAG: hypothetical protein A2355_09490 [Spirochaetes bacterium RIFOXYB1_FULL_32_8]